MKYSRRGGTQVLNVVEVMLGSNERADGIGPFLLTVTVAQANFVSAPIATMIGPAWQQLNVAMSMVTTSAHCYYGLLLHIETCMISTTK
jgi:hypothetical protein